jgi:hypothetical protein
MKISDVPLVERSEPLVRPAQLAHS